jgi:hypothetical protein
MPVFVGPENVPTIAVVDPGRPAPFGGSLIVTENVGGPAMLCDTPGDAIEPG